MSEAQDLIDEFNMWIERGTMPRMTAANTLILLEEIKRLTAEAEKWRNTALQLSNNHGQARNKVDNLEADYIISNRELLILQSELARRDEKIAEFEAMINPASFRKFLVEQIKDPELAEAYVKACIQDTTYKELLARRDEIIAKLKDDTDEIIARLKEDANSLATALNQHAVEEIESEYELLCAHIALMKELE